MASSGFYIPSVDIAPFIHDPSSDAAKDVIERVKQACVSTGFFQIFGHGVPKQVQKSAFDASAAFFSLPVDTKMALKAGPSTGFKGYEQLESQSYSYDVKGDAKEGFTISTDYPDGHPLRTLLNGRPRFLTAPNVWPTTDMMEDAEWFRASLEAYQEAMVTLRAHVLSLIAATLPYGPHVFDEMNREPACPLRYLHYPPMSEGTDIVTQQGASAHTDFSAVTLLLQGQQDGLEVLDYDTGEWHLVPPNPDAYVINLGDMMAKLLRGQYKSSKHRVINRAKVDRYSIVYFWDGNRDFELRPLDGAEMDQKHMTCEEYMFDRLKFSFGHHETKPEV
ncbi:Sexual differentiation process protein isp7 [Cytospora mali]|uniref:Sexual differentiation process protein isp7 n=1 Tax=Cytospora mali TaxID=578113 RepID=A0A194W5H8_CYTMA|nr:Sexual differentiation process protein isp7 [Valsa mali]